MNQIQLESAETELFSYLNGLISERAYPYLFQATGVYHASTLHAQIARLLEETAIGIENDRDGSEGRIEGCANEICQYLNEDLMSYLLEKATESIFLIDFQVFRKMIKNKLIEILCKK